jgi:hypothetical protein
VLQAQIPRAVPGAETPIARGEDKPVAATDPLARQITEVVAEEVLCPYCLKNAAVRKHSVSGRGIRFTCAECKEALPRRYVLEYWDFPPLVYSIIGLPAHGKSVFLWKHLAGFRQAATRWNEFRYYALDEEGEKVLAGWEAIERSGKLPDSTMQVFPRPTIIRVENAFGCLRANLLAYDTGGEVFKQQERLLKFAGYVHRADTIVWLVSLPISRRIANSSRC